MEVQVRFTADILRSERVYEGPVRVPDNFRELDTATQNYHLRKEWREWVGETAYGDYEEVESEDLED